MMAGYNRRPISFMYGLRTALIYAVLRQAFSYQPLRKKVVCFGASIVQRGFDIETNGWMAQLAHWWSRKADVLNRGYSGYNSRYARMIVEKAVINESPDLMLILLGSNDAIDKACDQHVPLLEYEQNMRYILATVQRKTEIILITPPPVDEDTLARKNAKAGKTLLVDRTNTRYANLIAIIPYHIISYFVCCRTLQYVNVCKSLGQELCIPVVDAYATLSDKPTATYLCDGLHLNANGCDALFAAVVEVITTTYPHWHTDQMPCDLPSRQQLQQLEHSKS